MNPYAEQLAAAVDLVVEAWVARSIRRLAGAAGLEPSDTEVAAAAADAARFVHDELRTFLALDVDDQRTNPLAVLRASVRYPTAVLVRLGVPAVRRDDFEVRAFPDDLYRLSPATWSDIDASLQEPGIIWGAWKAKTVLDRRRSEGRR